jgi:Carboxypeptidase regulatory-like domain
VSKFRTLAVFILAVLLALAQSERGSITGIVTDQSGAPVPNVSVVIINPATNTEERVTTTGAGDYTAANLEPGNYRVEIEAPGFKRFEEQGIMLTAGRAVRLNATLQVGQVNEQVEVQAQTTELQTENAKVSNAVDNKLVDQLPLVVGGAMRSPFDLVTITPQSKGSGTTLSLGGGQAASWGATLDGLPVNTNRSADAVETAYVTPSVESITEFAVDTNGFQAEFGQAGGGVITFASKSGTNQLHGTAYEFLRNDDFDARGFFAAQRSIYKQSDFGASAGGPVVIPKLYNGKNRTFFFLSYEGFRNRIGSNGQIFTVPAAEMYQGNFANWVNSKGQRLLIYDPLSTVANASGGYTRTPFPNNQIPVSRFSTISKEMLPYAQNVVPNRPGLVPGTPGYVQNNYISSGGTLENPTDKGSVKIDQNFGYNHHLGFFYNRTRYNSLPGPSGPSGLPEPLYTGQNSEYDSSVYRMDYDWIISPRLVNHFVIGGNEFTKNSFSPNVGQNWKSKICIPNVVDCNVNFPNLIFGDISNWGSTAYNGTEQPSWSLKEDLSYVFGSHNLKWGYAFESQRANGFGQQNISGQATFSFLETAVPGVTTQTSGSSFASFLLGAADAGATETVRYLPQTYDYHAWYMQDDWHVNKRLTVNMGLRYEFTLPPVAGGNQYSDFSPSTPNPAVNNYPGALIFAGYGPGRQNTRSLIPGWYGGWGPRLGFAYSLDPKTTIRAGAGRSFSRVTVVASSSHYAGFIGQYAFSSTNQGITPAFYWDTGLPSYPLPPQINPSFSNNTNVDWWQGNNATRAPEIDFWTFSIERQLGSNTVFEADYNGNAGNHLQSGIVNVNQVPMSIVNGLISQYGPTAAINLLNSNISSPAARAANIPIPYPNFTNSTIQHSQTAATALRPFPQYLTIDTSQSGGDKSGHSTYHALLLKLDRRFAYGLQFQWSYLFSKLLTDSDTYYANAGYAEDEGNRRLEKSIGAYDQTHVAKFNTIYELPFGTGKRWLTHGFLNQAFGGWRVSAIQLYASGFPVAVTRNASLPIFNGTNRPYITTYDWRATYSGSFDPAKDLFFNPAAFPTQPNYLLGNATRYNPLVRAFPMFNENVSLGKTFLLTERFHLDFRAEAFNLFNRVVFAAPTGSAANLNSISFGAVTSQANTPRQLQLGLKLYW